MINVSEAYKKACESSNRKSYVIAKYGQYDEKPKLIQSSYSGYKQEFSSYNNVLDGSYYNNEYISCEPNRVKLNGNFMFIKNKDKNSNLENIGYWGKELSNESGIIENANSNLFLSIKFSQPIILQNITLHFQEEINSLKINYIYEEKSIKEITLKNVNDKKIITSENFENDKYFDKLEVKILSTVYPFRFVKLNEIDFGEIRTFESEEIADFSIIQEISINNESIPSNQLTLTLKDNDGMYDILNPNNKLSYLEERQKISMYHYLQVDNEYQEVSLGTFLLKDFDINNQEVILTCYDDIYFMNKTYYGSNFYQNERLEKILTDLFSYFQYDNYIIDDDIKNITLSGYVPKVEFREALRMICEASKCLINKTRDGVTHIFNSNSNKNILFERKDIFLEAPLKNLYNNIIQIVEYNYDEIEEKEIFNTVLQSGENLIIFNDFPVEENSITKSLENEKYNDVNSENYLDYDNFEIIERHATSCKVIVNKENTLVILKGNLRKAKTTNKIYSSYGEKGEEYKLSRDYSVGNLNNNLITTLNSKSVADFKLSRSNIKYNFNTRVFPYIEVADKCIYETKYNTRNPFVVTKIEYSKSIIQNIEGE